MEYKTRYEQWMNDDFFEIETKQELSLIVKKLKTDFLVILNLVQGDCVVQLVQEQTV